MRMDSTQEIKSRLDIVDLVAEYLPLKSAGSNAFKTNCPFHGEKTPSFFVSRTRQSWHCFGCDQGGDHFTFVEKMEGMEFREALEFLAQKAGVVLPKFDGEKAGARKRLFEVNELAMRFYCSVLYQRPEAEVARQYLKRRGVDELTGDLFKLGYALPEWSAMSEALRQKGVTDDELVRAGLSVKNERGGVYDRFRGRLMFPIADVHGNIVGFTGRILADVSSFKLQASSPEAKYVNTPETQVYRKSAVLYGLDKAKGEIRAQDLAIIVEGNMDVIASHQFNISNVIASSGTALSGEQLGLIKRFTNRLAIAFDQDAAGKAATVRGLDLARAQDFSISIITLPPEAGKDPDEAVRKDPELWRAAVKNAVSIMEWIYRQAFKSHQAHDPEQKKIIAREVLPEIQRIADAVERDHWLKRLAQDLSVGEEALREAMKQIKVTSRNSPVKSQTPPSSHPPILPSSDHDHHRELEKRILSLILARAELHHLAVHDLSTAVDDFLEPDISALYALIQGEYPTGELNAEQGIKPESNKLLNALALQSEREFERQTLDELKRELMGAVAAARAAKTLRRRKHLEEEMKEAERIQDQSRIARLTEEFESLKS